MILEKIGRVTEKMRSRQKPAREQGRAVRLTKSFRATRNFAPLLTRGFPPNAAFFLLHAQK